MIATFGLVHLSFSQNYSPLVKGTKMYFEMENASYTNEILEETVQLDGHEYFQSKTKYSWGKEVINLLRLDEHGNELYLDPISNTESINFPATPELGFSWVSTDGAWKYEVFKIGETLRTPNKNYKDCLVIKAQQLTGRDKEKLGLYFNYYMDNIGYVGSKNSDGLMSWLVNEK